MKITTRDELNRVRKKSQKMATGRALLAGAASAFPGVAAGALADVGILYKLLPQISKNFGLDPEQIDELDEQIKQQILVAIGKMGSNFIGTKITKELILTALKAVSKRATAKAAASMVPVVGSAIGGVMGFAMMKFVANQHINECYRLIEEILELGPETAVAE